MSAFTDDADALLVSQQVRSFYHWKPFAAQQEREAGALSLGFCVEQVSNQ